MLCNRARGAKAPLSLQIGMQDFRNNFAYAYLGFVESAVLFNVVMVKFVWGLEPD